MDRPLSIEMDKPEAIIAGPFDGLQSVATKTPPGQIQN
jgi:hypothetical protein